MKSRTYTLILSGTLGSSILAFGACSSNTGQDSSGTDQVESALASVGPIQCRRAIRECADKSCANEIRAVLTSFPFSPRQLLAINALTECAVENCANACTAGTGGAAGAGGAPGTGGAAGSGGVATGGAAGGGGIATGGAAGGGGVATGGAAGSGGVATGGAAGAGGVATGGGGGVDAGVGGATATGGNAGAGGASTGGATGAGGMTGGGVDLNGTWISHVNTPGTISAPIVGSTAANIDIVLRLFVSESASTLTGTVEICRLNPVTTPNASSLVVTFSPAVLATLNATATEPAFTAMVGQPVPLPPVTILTGEDAMGSSVDSDMDGHPGVTIPSNVGGLIMLNAYTGLKITTTLTATLTDPTTIGGTTSFASTGTVFGSDNAILTSGSIDVTPSSNSIPFTATKLAGNVPCSQVLTMF